MSLENSPLATKLVPPRPQGRRRRDLLGHAVLAGLNLVARKAGLGRIDISLPSGARRVIGQAQGAVPIVSFRRWGAVCDVLRRGALGFAEAYLDNRIGIGDLQTAFEYVLANERAMLAVLPRLYRASSSARDYHASRANTRRGSRENIAAHYDLGNAFYAAWLDPSMLYSSGIYRNADDTLEIAQREKLDRIFAALDLAPGHSLLEIGCGWGEVACEAADRGARVKAITISSEQRDWSTHRVREAGLAARVEIAFEDYRDVQSTFDRIVSIEMIEAVGEQNWATYFSTLADRLVPGGRAVLQAITIDEHLFAHYRHNPDFIQRYIFPGGMLASVARMQAHAHAAGLQFETVETFGLSYARTLADWRVRFEAAWPAISRQAGFDERFRRMWLYYLIYCEVGFRHRFIDVGLYRLTKAAA